MIADVDQAVIDEVESAVRDAASEGNRDTE
jgi:hypothetical protein